MPAAVPRPRLCTFHDFHDAVWEWKRMASQSLMACSAAAMSWLAWCRCPLRGLA
jgi:hypothetical protein